MELRLFQEEEGVSWTDVQSPMTRKKYFADVVKSPPLSGTNPEPIEEPKISEQLRDRLLFPRRSAFERLIAINSGPFNQPHAGFPRLAVACSSCLAAGHPRVKCRQLIRCSACMGWGHIAALCRAPPL